jgi:hypothetical protein
MIDLNIRETSEEDYYSCDFCDGQLNIYKVAGEIDSYYAGRMLICEGCFGPFVEKVRLLFDPKLKAFT